MGDDRDARADLRRQALPLPIQRRTLKQPVQQSRLCIMPIEFLMLFIVIGFYLAVSKTLSHYRDDDFDKAARLALLEEPTVPPQDSRRF